MSTSDTVDNFLAHYGTKGMRWGVRNNIQRRSGAERSAYVNAKDAKWVGKVEGNPKISKVARIAARDAKKQTKKLNQDYKARGLNVKKNGIDRTRYDNELKDILQHSVERASYKVHKISPTGLKEVQIHRHPDGSLSATVGTRDNAKIRKQQRKIAKADQKAAKKIKHADTDEVVADDFDGLEFLLILDADGFVDDILTPFDDDLEQSDTSEFLEHYGIKGMQWGVRRTPGPSGTVSSSPAAKASVKPAWQSPPTTKKGQRREAKALARMPSEDAMVFNALRAKAQKGGISALSNDEIRVLTTRARAIEDFKRSLPPAKKSKKAQAVDFIVGEVLVNTGKQLVKDVAKYKGQEALIKGKHLPPRKKPGGNNNDDD